MRHLPLHALRVFETTSRHKTFEIAAKELHITQSAVSHQIRRLESFLGAPLYDRSGSHHKLLPHAQALALTLSGSLAQIDSACRRAQRHSRHQSLVIAVIPSIATCLLIPNLSDYRKKFPKINLRILYAIHGQEIDYREVDIAFVFSKTAPSGSEIRSTEFLSGEGIPVCNPEKFKKMGNLPLDKAFIKTGLLHDTNRSGWKHWFARFKSNQSPDLSGPIFEDFNLLRIAALAGQGIAICPKALIGDDLKSGRLVQLSEISIQDNYNYFFIEKLSQSPSVVEAISSFKTWVYSTCNA